MNRLWEKMKRLGRKGQTTTEYVIILGLVALGSIAVILLFGNQVRSLFAAATGRLAGQDTAVQDYSRDAEDATEADDLRDAFEGF